MSTILYKDHKVLCDSMCYISAGDETHYRIGANKMFLSTCGRMVFAAVGIEYEQKDVDKIFESWAPKFEQFYQNDDDPSALIPTNVAMLRKEAWYPYIRSNALLFTKQHVVYLKEGPNFPRYNRHNHSFSIGTGTELSSMLLRMDMSIEEVARLVHRTTATVAPPYKVIDITTLNGWEFK